MRLQITKHEATPSLAESENNTNTDAALSEPSVQAHWPGWSDAFDLCGIRAQGFNIDNVESARLFIDIPIRGGKYLFPTPFEPARVRFDDCNAQVELNLVKSADGELTIQGVDFSLSEDAVIENPASAFTPRRGGIFGGAINACADHLVKAHIKRVNVNAQGTLFLDGTLVKAGLAKTPLSELEGMNFPKLDMRVKAFSAMMSTSNKVSHFYEELFKTFGQMGDRASYSLDIKAKESKVSLESDAFKIESDHEPVYAHVEGNFLVNESLDMSLSADAERSFLQGLFDKLLLSGHLQLQHPLAETAHVELHLCAQNAADEVDLDASIDVLSTFQNFTTLNGKSRLSTFQRDVPPNEPV